MGNESTLDKVVGTVKMMAILLAMILLMGAATVAVWSLIKIPLWLMSPWRGSIDTRQSVVMGLSFKRMIWTPYTWPIMWTSGWGSLFFAMIIVNMDNPGSPMWTEPYMFPGILIMGSVLWFVAVYCMICEVIMIFNFRNWVHNMVDLGHNPL